MNAVRRVPLLRLSGAQSYGRPRREIFTSEVATIRLPPKSISSVRPQPSISISVAQAPLSERSDEKIMTAGDTSDGGC